MAHHPSQSRSLGALNIPAPRTRQRQAVLPGRNEEHTPPNDEFRFVHYGLWDFHQGETPDDDQWLPFLNEVAYKAGVNGVASVIDSNGRDTGHVDPASLQAAVLRQKGILIQPDDPKLNSFYHGLGYPPERWTYLGFMPIAGGGVHWVTQWTRFQSTLNGRKAIKRPDTETHNRFKRYLYENGIIAPMGVEILEEAISQIQGKLRVARQYVSRSKSSLNDMAAREQQAAERIERMQAAYDRQFGGMDGLAAGPLLSPTPSTPSAAPIDPLIPPGETVHASAATVTDTTPGGDQPPKRSLRSKTKK